MLHKNINIGDVHKIHNFEVNNQTELNALVLSASDLGKVAWKKDTNVFLFLSSVSPATWIGLGSANSTIKQTIGDIAFNAVSPVSIGDAESGKRVIQITVIIPEAFDALDASVTVGTDSQVDLLVSSLDIDISEVGTFTIEPNYLFQTNEVIKLFINPGTSATTGKVFVSITFSN